MTEPTMQPQTLREQITPDNPKTARLHSEIDANIRPHIEQVAIGLYNFIATTRRLGERPTQLMDLSQSEMEVIHFIASHPGCGVSDIARLRFLRPSNVSATVRRLLDSGLLIRKNSNSDRRAQHLYVSPEGRKVIEGLVDHWCDIVGRIIYTMDPSDVRALVKGMPPLMKLAEHSEHYVEQIQTKPEQA